MLHKYTLGFLVLICVSCIKDDLLEDAMEPEVRITTRLDSLALDSTFQLSYLYLNNIGQEETVSATWGSSNPSILNINQNGLVTALQLGSAEIDVAVHAQNHWVTDTIEIVVGTKTVMEDLDKGGVLQSTSSYDLSGDFSISEDGSGGLIIQFEENYIADRALPGLYIYLSNNTQSTSGAMEIGPVEVFSGSHQYVIPNTNINQYRYLLYFCKPFNARVGHGEII